MSLGTKEDALELIRTFLPKYLTPELQENLFSVVKDNFPISSDPNLVYQNLPDTSIYYQGDGIMEIPFSEFIPKKNSFQNIYLDGVIISNSCDISPENERLEKPKIQFAVINSLKEYVDILKAKNVSERKIEIFIDNLRNNRITNLFYLPEKRNDTDVIMEESFVRFDMNVSLPLEVLDEDIFNKNYKPEGDRLFSFSNYGFYLFLIKLSVHYSRFREGVFRSA